MEINEVKTKIEEINEKLNNIESYPVGSNDRYILLESLRMYKIQLERLEHPERFVTRSIESFLK